MPTQFVLLSFTLPILDCLTTLVVYFGLLHPLSLSYSSCRTHVLCGSRVLLRLSCDLSIGKTCALG